MNTASCYVRINKCSFAKDDEGFAREDKCFTRNEEGSFARNDECFAWDNSILQRMIRF